MPDWITHVLTAWTLCTVLSFKYKQFNSANTAICIAGSLIPDTFKIIIPLGYMGMHIENFIAPLHLPIGSFIIASLFSLLFKEKKLVLSFLLLGVLTHYALDLLLTNLSGGIYLLFPFTWNYLQFDIIPDDDYSLTIISIFVAVLVYFMSKYVKPDNN